MDIPALTLPPIAAAYDLLSGFETTIERKSKKYLHHNQHQLKEELLTYYKDITFYKSL